MQIDIAEKPAIKCLPRFVPVIFANGEDDDAPGLQAAFDNEAVQFDSRIYEPGDEVVITGRHIVIGMPVESQGIGRHVRLDECYLDTSRLK